MLVFFIEIHQKTIYIDPPTATALRFIISEFHIILLLGAALLITPSFNPALQDAGKTIHDRLLGKHKEPRIIIKRVAVRSTEEGFQSFSPDVQVSQLIH